MLNGQLLRRAIDRSRATPRLGRQVALLIAPYGLSQGVRLAANIALTRLLAPEVFGVMMLINSLRTGTELLSDIGIGQSVVRSKHGDDHAFLDAAWTLQIIRGALLTIVALLAANPVARIYDRPELAPLIMTLSPIFLFTALQSPALFIAQRKMKLARRALYDIVNASVHAALAIGLALVIPSVWALVIGLLLGTLSSTAMTYVFFDRRLPRLVWNPAFTREIIGFGKWIFLSTAIYFAAVSFDRLYFVGVLPLALAGVYGVARTFADMLGSLAQRAGAFLVFPRAANMADDDQSAPARLRAKRRAPLAMVAMATGLAIAGADQFILLAYDERYHAAAFMIPILLASVWFGMLSSFADSLLMGRGRPAPGALANGVKFTALLIGLPWAIAEGSLLAALLVLVLSEIVRWMTLTPWSHRAGFSRLGDDILLTALVAGSALAAKAAAGYLGLVPTLWEWWAMRELLTA